MTAPDPARVEVFANLFRGIVDEMAWIVLRSSHTTFVKETQDFSTGLITPDGQVFAYPHASGATALVGIPMHAGTRAVDDWAPGDVLITNDPYATGGMVMHLNDLYVFRPVFSGGRVLCFAWAFIHCTDVGGAVPGSIDMWHHEVFQEGVRLRPVRLYRRGELNRELWNVFADNCRIPGLNWGDVTALMAALASAERRMLRLVERYGDGAVRAATYATIDRTERLARGVLARIPAGSYRFTEYFEDDYATDLPVRLEVCMTSDGRGGVRLDFAGSDPQVRSALNLPTGGLRHHPFLCLGLVNHVATEVPGLHLNAGITRCIALELPPSSVVNASFPAAVGLRYTTARRIHDLVLGALTQALGGGVPAGGMGATVVTYVSTSELGRAGRVVVANPVQGGSGGGPAMDGVSGVDFPSAFLRNVPVEVLESEAPVVVHRYALRPDTEGAGRWRGGFGAAYELEVRHPLATVVMRGKDRHRFTPFGAHGGRAGTACGNRAVRRDGTVRDIGKRTVDRPAPGEVIEIHTGGGGGFGSPLAREPALVLRDVEDGLVSPARARDAYGVAIRDGAVEEGATAALRAAAGAEAACGFDFGTARTAWERTHRAASDRIAAALCRVPAPLRRYAQHRAYDELATSPPPWDGARIDAAIERAVSALEPAAAAPAPAAAEAPAAAREGGVR